MRPRDQNSRGPLCLPIYELEFSHSLERAYAGKIGVGHTQYFPQTPQPLFFKKFALCLTHFNAGFRREDGTERQDARRSQTHRPFNSRLCYSRNVFMYGESPRAIYSSSTNRGVWSVSICLCKRHLPKNIFLQRMHAQVVASIQTS